MLEVLTVKTNPVDRHALLAGIVGHGYHFRAEPNMGLDCALAAKLFLSEFPLIANEVTGDTRTAASPIFGTYAKLLVEQGEPEGAIEVCQLAVKFGLRDHTKTGFSGRIERIKR
jgi:hypothetical protein